MARCLWAVPAFDAAASLGTLSLVSRRSVVVDLDLCSGPANIRQQWSATSMALLSKDQAMQCSLSCPCPCACMRLQMGIWWR